MVRLKDLIIWSARGLVIGFSGFLVLIGFGILNAILPILGILLVLASIPVSGLIATVVVKTIN